MNPVIASLIIGAVAGGANAVSGSAQNGSSNRNALRIAELQDRGATQRTQMQTGLAESAMDPFRQQMFQARNLSRLGMMSAPRNTQTVSKDVRYQRTPYTPSPELMSWLQAIQQNIAGGQNRAASVSGLTNGSSAMNLLDPATMANPGASRGFQPPNFPPTTQPTDDGGYGI